jgi:hypothetical protein
MFGKWDVVLAAYNAGDGKIRRLVAKADPAGLRLPNVINKYIARLLAVFTMAEKRRSTGLRQSTTIKSKRSHMWK